MKFKTIFIILFTVFYINSLAAQPILDKEYTDNEIERELNPILLNLCKVRGLKKNLYIKPSNRSKFVALALVKEDSVSFEKKAFGRIKKHFSDTLDQKSAFAIILGHEIEHFYQEGGTTDQGYLSKFKERNESTADITGIFNTIVAHHKISLDILKKLDSVIYEVTPRYDSKNQNYPSREVRTRRADNIYAKVDSLNQLFNIANACLKVGQYQYATVLYKNIMEQYPAPQLYNNLGIAYISWARELHNKIDSSNLDLYWLPLGINTKPVFGDNLVTKSLTAINDTILLQKGIHFLEVAEERFTCSQTTKTNLLCAYKLWTLYGFQGKNYKNAMNDLLIQSCDDNPCIHLQKEMILDLGQFEQDFSGKGCEIQRTMYAYNRSISNPRAKSSCNSNCANASYQNYEEKYLFKKIELGTRQLALCIHHSKENSIENICFFEWEEGNIKKRVMIEISAEDTNNSITSPPLFSMGGETLYYRCDVHKSTFELDKKNNRIKQIIRSVEANN
jgi:hypothetical protein